MAEMETLVLPILGLAAAVAHLLLAEMEQARRQGMAGPAQPHLFLAALLLTQVVVAVASREARLAQAVPAAAVPEQITTLLAQRERLTQAAAVAVAVMRQIPVETAALAAPVS
jgi:uncharacterized lipoprotein YajG